MSKSKKTIPQSVQEMITRFQNLRINGNKVQTPYFRNVKHERAGLLALLGKGTPREIEQEVLVYAKLRGVELSGMGSPKIREFMQNQGIGIDCSGYISHLLHAWLKNEYHSSLYTRIVFPRASIIRSIIRWFRPVANTDAQTLTNTDNTTPIKLKDVRPGDLIRLKGIDFGHHIALIMEVEYDEKNLPTMITYTHSTNNYGATNGVRIGQINVTDSSKDLAKQKWLEVDNNGHCWTLEQLLKDYEDNGLRRPKFLPLTND